MNSNQILKWEILRQQGKIAFVIKFGVIRWGLFTALFFSLLMHFLQPMESLWLRPLISFVLFPLGGIFFGLSVWTNNEDKYRKFISRVGGEKIGFASSLLTHSKPE